MLGFTPSSEWWARQGLNLRPHPCEGLFSAMNGGIASTDRGTDHDSSANEAGLSDHGLTTPRQHRFKRPQGSGVIYFLAGGGLIKIGITVSLTSRLRAIRNSSPVPIELLAKMEGKDQFVEMQLHSRFSALRKHGEWFEDDGAIRAYVDELVRFGKAVRT
jgi:hypothetical protein